MLVTLGNSAARPLVQRGSNFDFGTFSHDGQSILATELSGSLTRIVSIPVNGGTPQILFTVANLVWYLDSGRDGSVYMSLTDRPSELVRRPLSGGEVEHIASFPQQSESDTITVLPDGRTVLSAVTSGRPRLVLVEKGKEPVRLVSTAEETSTPAAAAGTNEVAFVIGPAPHQTIAIAEVASGRIARRIPLNKGEIQSLASSPDGATLYAAAGGSVWAIPLTGELRNIRAGDSVTVDPSGRHLVIGIYEGSKFKLFRVPTDSGGDGGPEQEIMISSTKPLMSYPLSPNALNSEGSLLHPLSPVDSWFNAIGLVNTATGKLTFVRCDDISDYHSMAWLPDGRIMALHIGLRSTLWRFQPQK